MQLVRAGQRVKVEPGVHLVKFVEDALEGLLLALVPHGGLHLVDGPVAQGRPVRVGDRHSVLVRRNLERQVLIRMILPVDSLLLHKFRKILLIVDAILQLIIRRRLLFAGDKG